MQGVSTEKVVGGKLLRVKVDFDSKINQVRITGDFFAHPEDVIEKIENSLSGLSVNAGEEEMRHKIENVITKTGADVVGIDAASIARNIMKAVGVSQ
ncbi:MAG: hypothetical protein HYT71_02520 [Candidatus Aenigmarchaeota archaeon]|nr:hypothetical protein [Candidatus Aenigmarchaeota archaeon]